MFSNEEITRLLDVANTGLHKGEVALARKVYEGILAERPEHAPTLISLALSHIVVGEYETADTILNDRVLAKNPADADALVYLGLSAKLAGRNEQAEEILSRVPAGGSAGALAESLRAI